MNKLIEIQETTSTDPKKHDDRIIIQSTNLQKESYKAIAKGKTNTISKWTSMKSQNHI